MKRWLAFLCSLLVAVTASAQLSIPSQLAGIFDTTTGQLVSVTNGVPGVAPQVVGGVPTTFSPQDFFGDSLTTYNNVFVTPTGVARVGGVTTITVAGGHTLSQDARVRCYNLAGQPGTGLDSSFDVADIGVTRIDGNNFSYLNPGPDATITPSATTSSCRRK